MTELGSGPFLVALELRLQGGELGERRIRIGLAPPLLRIDPLACFTAVPILEVAPALAPRTIPALAIRSFAAPALTLRRTAFTIRPLAFGSIASMTRAALRDGTDRREPAEAFLTLFFKR